MHGRGLMTLGMKKGDRICLISENRPEWVIFDLAILSIGAVTVPIYATSTLEQMTHIIEHCEAKMVIVSNATLLEQLRKHSPHSHVEHWVCFEKTLKPSKCMTPLWIAEHSSKTDNFSFYQTVSLVTPQDLATIVYTSGTTGEPKGVMLSHENIVSNTIASAKMIPIQEDDISLSFLPLSHLFERMAGFFCFMYFGAKIYFAEDVHKVPENLTGSTSNHSHLCATRVLEKVYNKVFEEVENRWERSQNTFFAHSSENQESALLRASIPPYSFKKSKPEWVVN
jgi:long-chain acyl-CoA synthetase